MKIAFDIDEEEMKQSILGVLVKQGMEEAAAIFGNAEHYVFIRKLYRDDMQKSVREMLKAHEAEIIDRAVIKAAEMIARKALPKLMERMGEYGQRSGVSPERRAEHLPDHGETAGN